MLTEITNTRDDRGGRGGLATALVTLVAGVWLVHGLYNKLLGGSPRHLLIIQSVPGLGGARGQLVLAAIGVIECAIALWILTGWRPRLCAAAQTALLLSMNVVELTYARAHLLAPVALLPVNVLFLALAWLAAETYRLHRHPIPIAAFFRRCLVLTYAIPEEVLRPLLPPGLTLDTHNGYGFVAVALVQTRDLRPVFLPPALGQDFFLTGYRVFTKFQHAGRTRRGLRILRSDANRRRMVIGGNAMTHYNYAKCESFISDADGQFDVAICTPRGVADLHVVADLSSAGGLPSGSPFRSEHEARRFAGPLPFTFDYEPQTHSIITIRGVRENWRPRPVNVDVRQINFFNREPFRRCKPILAAAFYVHDVPYRWERGVRHPLEEKSS